MSPQAAYTQGSVWTRWRDTAPGQPVAAWTKSHATNTSVTWTLCGRPVPVAPYLQDVNDEIPAGWPKCKKCIAQAMYWGAAHARTTYGLTDDELKAVR